jgi:predicted ATP-dependent endonuclease of OLD family
MFISKIEIKNYRNFKEENIEFNDGINVVVGHNNAGKTNLIKAISLVIDSNSSKRLSIEDFNKNLSLAELQKEPPRVLITLTINRGEVNEPDDLVIISNWLTKIDSSYEAKISYDFFLPEKKLKQYIEDVSQISESGIESSNKVWKIIREDYLRFYTYRIWGGNPAKQERAESDSLNRIDFQFLDAIRDVERDMLSGRNHLLRDIFEFFLDYEIKIDKKINVVEKEKSIKERKEEFSAKSEELMKYLYSRLEKGKEEILSYAKKTGASFNKANPNFGSEVSESDMYSVLKLIIEYETGMKIPATHNGLGYNNLIYMSLLLAKMQVNADEEYLDSNAKVFSVLAIEEPEAHLHPSMQYKFLKFLNDHRIEKKVRQIFITSHSTHITSAISLDNIICLHNENDIINIGYPRKVFNGKEFLKSKNYVQRFLDATKADMLFSQKVIFVEGIAEQVLMSVFARYLGYSLEDNHVSVINVGGRYFNHFLKIFDSTNEHTIPKKIVCLTDIDPERKLKTKGQYEKCYPFELDSNDDYEYKINAFSQEYKKGTHPNITVYSQNPEYGKTFEYELVLSNADSDLLVTDSILNNSEIRSLMKLYNKGSSIEDLYNTLSKTKENERICNGIKNNSKFSDDEKKKAIIASRYLNSVGKGENALELSYSLLKNLEMKETDEYKIFNVPDYIKESILEICR